MNEYDYTKSIHYWIAYAEAAHDNLQFLRTQPNVHKIRLAIALSESAIKESYWRIMELGADVEDIAKLARMIDE